MNATTKRECAWCQRVVTPEHAHKWTQAQHAEIWPGQPFIDAWCPGGKAGAR